MMPRAEDQQISFPIFGTIIHSNLLKCSINLLVVIMSFLSFRLTSGVTATTSGRGIGNHVELNKTCRSYPSQKLSENDK